MSPLQLVLAGTALELGYFAFEVPTGIVADLYSRRASIVVAQFVMGLGFLLTAVQDVPVILFAAALVGFGWTFKSGAIDAWLADEVGTDRLPAEYQRGAQVARIASLAGIGGAVALALVDLRLPVLGGGILLFGLGSFLVLAMPETGFSPAERHEFSTLRSVARTAREGARLIRATPVLVVMLGIMFFDGLSAEGFDRLWEAHFLRDVGVPSFAGLSSVVWFGILNAGAVLLAVVVAQPLARHFARASSRGMAGSLLGLDVALIAALAVFAFAGSFTLAVAAYWGARVAGSLAGPVYSTWLNTNIEDSRVRATVISITNMSESVGEWGGGPGLGVVGNVYGVRAALAAGAVALTPAVALYGLALRGSERDSPLEALPQAEA
jgi:DHA3 family tetracycline resistance protein-like MFS transporter